MTTSTLPRPTTTCPTTCPACSLCLHLHLDEASHCTSCGAVIA